MKKNHLRALCRLFISSAILLMVAPLGAQVSDPSAWTEFVESSEMPQIIDTFRMQTFSLSDKDNWNYTLSGGAALSEEENALKIPLGGRIELEPYSLLEYQRVSVGIVFSAQIVAGDTLYVEMDNKRKTNIKGAIYPFKGFKGANSKELIKLNNTPNNIVFYALNKKMGTSDGYYLIDSVFAVDTTSCYSLFTGSGNWTNNDCWSSLAPYRQRGALIGGDVEVNTSVGCGLISISDGSLKITEEGELTTDTLCMHDADFSISSAGKFTVEKMATIYHTFPEKGKWYFLSFPFDVNLDGIDSRFTLEDDQFEGGGNYIYVQTYDGDKRTTTQTAKGNWTTFTVPSSNPIVFERGKGYLVALDEAAEYTTLTFSATEGNIPANFGASASIPVEVATSASKDKSGNNGWYLCGNPLPAPLSLSRISSNTALDGYIYIYNNGAYTPYNINGNYELPPLAAFFVKASAETMLSITDELPATKAVLLRTDSPLSADAAEPRSVATGLSEVMDKDASVDMSLEGNVLHLFGLPSSGRLQAIDTAGRVVYSCSLPQGTSVCSLPLRDGVYILVIEAENYTHRQKFSIHF